MQVSRELVGATDKTIEQAIAQADPLVLRGLLFQLTGNEELVEMAMVREQFGFSFIDRIANESDVATVRRLAVEFLKELRDGEALLGQLDVPAAVTEVDMGPTDRLPQSLGLIAGAP